MNCILEESVLLLQVGNIYVNTALKGKWQENLKL